MCIAGYCVNVTFKNNALQAEPPIAADKEACGLSNVLILCADELAIVNVSIWAMRTV